MDQKITLDAASHRNRINILLVDDQPRKLLTYEVMLRELGQTLIKAGSARDALEALLKSEVALILMDVSMPDLDGIELATLIRDHPRYRKIPIIFVSALQVTDLDRLRGYEAGAVDYVPVPVVPELLRAKVKVFVDLYVKTRQLEQVNAELEHRVADRTIALEHSSRELQRLNLELEERVEARTREREAALAQLFEAQKMETIGQLTGGVAHDFNNLLMAITGSLELLKKRLPDDARMHRLLDTAMHGADRGASLTQRLLAFSRRQELKPEAVDVARLIVDMTDLFERALGPGIKLETLVPEELQAARVDGHQLELAILNLVVNAKDAMPEGGSLKITCAEIFAGEDDGVVPGDYVFVRVADTGQGMDAATVAKAREPFFTTKGVGKGTGLGLSMVHGLAAQSGGAMRIDSNSGHGTRVDILLPVAREMAVAPLRPGRVESGRCGPNPACVVLLVDDDPLVVAGTSAMLEDLGHTVKPASCAAEALKLLEGTLPDLVLTDHVMPGMTGLTLARRIAESHPTLPIVIATGYAEIADLAGAPEFRRIGKPFRQCELADAMSRAMENRLSNDAT